MDYNADDIKDIISTMVRVNKKGNVVPYSWEDVVEAFTEDEVEVMREYYYNSEIPFTTESVKRRADCIYAFMRLMAVEYTIDNDLGLAEDIIYWLNNFYYM